MADSASISIADFDGQTGVFGMNTVELTAANFDAQAAALLAVKDSLPAIIDGIVIATNMNSKIKYQVSGFKAPDPNAQRGNKWLVSSHDTLLNLGAGVPNPSYLNPFTAEIPTADLELRVDNKNSVWVNGGAGNVAAFDAFVAAYEAYAKSPNGGSLGVDEIEAVTASGG